MSVSGRGQLDGGQGRVPSSPVRAAMPRPQAALLPVVCCCALIGRVAALIHRMSDAPKKSVPLPGSVRRRTVGAAPAEWVKEGRLPDRPVLPCVIRPAVEGVDLVAWAKSERARVDALLDEHRALLLRGFGIDHVDRFQAFVDATSNGERLEYRDRTTPRTSEGDRIYTATVHPKDQRIHPHNEGTYWIRWAMKLYFCCLRVPASGGETPIVDVRAVFDGIAPEIRAEFMRRRFMLVRNYNDGFGLPWQEVFQTQSKAEVEAFCRANRIEFAWRDGDRLTTRQVRPAVRRHPRTGELVWFNHAAFYHHSTLEPAIRDALVSEFGEDGLPYNTCFGDGAPIAPDVVRHIREAYERERVVFPWQPGDVMLLDNMSVAHAREPYTGERLVIVAMTDAVDEEACRAG